MVVCCSHLQWALWYARELGPVFPTHGKKPLRGSHGWKDATTDEAKIRRWWTRNPEADVSLACGYTFMALDVDPDHGGDDSLAELEAEHGKLPLTLRQLSGGGGTHILFQPIPGLRNVAGGQQKGWWTLSGLDIRTLGGSILAAPSMHPETGALYRWAHEGRENRPPLAEAPGWLVVLMTPPPDPEPTVFRIEGIDGLKSYARSALDGPKGARVTIENAPFGCQRLTLNTEAFSIGTRVGAGLLDRQVAESTLIAAGLRMPSEEGRKKWTFADVAFVVRNGISDGIKNGRFSQKIALQRR